ncbi:MAG: hypothetical protein Q4B90_07220 [Eubacteriales bacterium]|nr:hypothetical protein [Eubacteriales bacterium]
MIDLKNISLAIIVISLIIFMYLEKKREAKKSETSEYEEQIFGTAETLIDHSAQNGMMPENQEIVMMDLCTPIKK